MGKQVKSLRGADEKKGAESTKEVRIFDRVGTNGNSDKVKKDRADQKMKALKIEVELEITNSDKSGNNRRQLIRFNSLIRKN